MPPRITADDADYFERQYGIRVRENAAVEYAGDPAKGIQRGKVVGVARGKLLVLLDGETTPGIYHPTWKIRILQEAP